MKKNGKLRPLGIPTIKDRVYQNIVRNALEPQWEARFEAIFTGFVLSEVPMMPYEAFSIESTGHKEEMDI